MKLESKYVGGLNARLMCDRQELRKATLCRLFHINTAQMTTPAPKKPKLRLSSYELMPFPFYTLLHALYRIYPTSPCNPMPYAELSQYKASCWVDFYRFLRKVPHEPLRRCYVHKIEHMRVPFFSQPKYGSHTRAYGGSK